MELELNNTSFTTPSLSNERIHRDDAAPAQFSTELKPVDRGRGAWQLLIAAFIFEALFWGFPTSYGVFQAYYTGLPEFAAESANIAVVGTLAQGLYYLGAPFSAALTKRFPKYQRHQILLGWPMCILGLLTASFANNVATLIATQGVMYGLGFVILTYPIIDMVNEWWVARKGMAFGLISAASGVAGIFMPLVLEALLQRYGYKITLRVCAVAMIILTAPFIPLLKSRLPPSEITHQPKTDWSFLRKPLFYFYALAMTVHGFGFFIPPIFIASYAVSVGTSSIQAAALLAVMALFQTVGGFALGWLSDKKIPVSLLGSVCCVVAALATLTLWGLGKSLPTLMVYSIIYGFFAFGYSTLRVAMGRAVTKEQSAVLATYSIFVFVQGIGNVLVGPVAAGLMSGSISIADYGASRYKSTIIFVAASLFVTAILMILPHFRKLFNTLLT